MDSDGTRQRRLTGSSARDSNPDWSPDGTRLVFQSNRDRNSDDLYAIQSDGSQLECLTTGPTADWTPAWSPDGSQIAFTIANYDNGREDIAVLDLETAVIARFVISDSFDIEPDWQPVPVNIAP
jgi:TolB protein